MVMGDLSVDISDGIGFYPGIVTDVSRFGIGLRDLPKKLDTDGTRLVLVVSGRDSHFKMPVRPRWVSKEGLRRSVGVEISNAPWGWTEFVMEYEPRVNEDVWGEINL